MIKDSQFVPFQKLLSKDQIRSLSPATSFLYQAIWNRLRMRGAIEISMSDVDAMQRARCAPEFLPIVQAELHRSGLLDVEPVFNPRLRPGEEKTTYRLPQTEQTEST